ncbi:unnamed protein product [Alopecurus aequalis]
MAMEVGEKIEAAAVEFGYPAQVRPGTTRVGWIGIGVMGGAMAGRLLAAGYAVTAYARTPAKADYLVAAAARAAGCHAVDAPVSGGDVGARDGTLALLAGGDEAVVAWLAPLFAHLGRPTYMGPPGSGQSSKIANQIAVAGAVVGLSESLAFADAARLDARLFLGAVSKGAAGSRVMDLFGDRVLSRDFATGGAVRYMIKDLGMALEVGDGQEHEKEASVLPGAALNRQMLSAMVANGDGDLCLQGLITVVERLNGIRK